MCTGETHDVVLQDGWSTPPEADGAALKIIAQHQTLPLFAEQVELSLQHVKRDEFFMHHAINPVPNAPHCNSPSLFTLTYNCSTLSYHYDHIYCRPQES